MLLAVNDTVLEIFAPLSALWLPVRTAVAG